MMCKNVKWEKDDSFGFPVFRGTIAGIDMVVWDDQEHSGWTYAEDGSHDLHRGNASAHSAKRKACFFAHQKRKKAV
jgi:hypothetical protein